MISANKLCLRRGKRLLLEDAMFTIYAGQHVGIVGRNGTGKSTLFAAILGELAPDRGVLSVQKDLAIATVAQDTPALPDLAIEFALDGDSELRDLERRLCTAEAGDDAHQIGEIHERLGQIDGYAARSRAARLLRGLGFSEEAQARPISSFSGGWRMRLNLARALMKRSELMLLDEPTNHLDLDAVLWLQTWLATYPGTMLVISHDREFLDAVTGHTLHLENSKATLYTGNYSQFERMRAERLTLQAGAHAKQQKEIAHLQKFINRFRASASKASQAQSRVKALERMEMVAAVHADSEFSFEFPTPERLPSPLIRFDDADAGYGSTVILRKLRLLIAPGERIGLLGPNGAGKSTLVQTIAGSLAPLSGLVMRDPYLKVGYFAQHTSDSLDPKASAMVHLKRLDPKASELALRTFLGGFNFKGDRAFEPVEPFSGGEKARLALAMVVFQKPNLLLLDEPTNHLDLDMRHALEVALQEFAGAVLLVSHDRHLLTSTCDQLWLVANGECRGFDDDLDGYAKWLANRERQNAKATSAAPKSSGASSSKSAKAQADAAKAEVLPLQESLKKLDKRIERLQLKLEGLNKQLENPDLYSKQPAQAQTLLHDQAKVQAELAGVEGEWLLLAERLEALEGASAD